YKAKIKENIKKKKKKVIHEKNIKNLIRYRDFTKPNIKEARKSKSSTNFKKNMEKDVSVGDKAQHNKWGTGTIVQIKERENDKELVIAFDKEDGLKRLLLSRAPIEIIRG